MVTPAKTVSSPKKSPVRQSVVALTMSPNSFLNGASPSKAPLSLSVTAPEMEAASTEKLANNAKAPITAKVFIWLGLVLIGNGARVGELLSTAAWPGQGP